MKILIVDDSKAMRRIVRRALQGDATLAGATVREADDGAEALQIIEDWLPHVVLCDWHMPKMSGLDLLEKLQQHGSDIAFGFITSEHHVEQVKRALDSGARFVLTKPFTSASLQRALARVV